MFYPQEVIEQVLEANNIVDVISEYVKLTKKGSTYFGLCPFHNEKTPSFSVTDHADRRMFYCFGCHTGGNVLTFLMKYENLTYTEGLKVLAERAGITLPEPKYSREDEEKHRLREQVLRVNKEAAVYYYHLLASERGKAAYRYLKNRNLSDQTIKNFGLGYSDKYRDDLYRYIKAKGYPDEVLKATGLFSIREQGVNDYFWNRVMFPIMDARSRVVAFGGRVMGDGEPKYLNSPETVVFEKRRTLFGLHIAKKYKGSELILCEGYMDVISLHQAGFSNAVASLGTALTAGHAQVLKRFTSHVVLSYDADNAGQNAALRAIPILRDAGLYVKVIDLKPYKDPDELIKAEGAKAYQERLNSARNSLLFEIDMLKGSFDMADPDSRTNFYNETARRLSYLDDEIERENYLQTVSREFSIDYSMLKNRTIRYALNRDGQRPPVMEKTDRSENRKEPKALAKSMQIVLRFLAEHPDVYGKTEKILETDDFRTEPYKTVAGLLFEQIRRGRIDISSIIGAFSEEDDQEKAADIFSRTETEGSGAEEEKEFSDCVMQIKRSSLEAKMEEETDIIRVFELRRELELLKNNPELWKKQDGEY